MSTPYGTATDGTPLPWDVKMPVGATRVPWILEVSSGHWVVNEPIPGDVVSAINGIGWCSVKVFHHLAPPNVIPGQVSDGRWPWQTDDLLIALAAALADARCDGRIGIMGGSGGGNIAAWLQAQGKVFAAVCFSPATYLPDLVLAGGRPAANAINYAPIVSDQISASPLNYLAVGVSTPVMLVAFQTDDMPMNQYTDYDDALVALGIDHESILVSGTGHSWAARSYVDWLGFLQSKLPPLT